MPEAVVDRLEAVQVHIQHSDLLAASPRPGLRVFRSVEEQSPIRQVGQRVVKRLALVQAPGEQVGDARGDYERAVDRGPQPRLFPGSRMVVHGHGVDHADGPVLQEDETNRNQEQHPILVQRDHGQGDEEMEVHLDVAAGEMHQQ